MTQDEKKAAIQNFKEAIQQEKRNLGYFIEDIPDIIKDKQLEHEYEKEQAATNEYKSNLQKAKAYERQLEASGIKDIPAAYQRAQASHDEAKADYEELYKRYAEQIPQLAKHHAKDKMGTRLIYIALILIIAAFFFDSLPFGIVGFVMLVIAAIYSIRVDKSKKATEKYIPPELAAAKIRLDEAEKELGKITALQQTQQEYDVVLEKIMSYQKSHEIEAAKRGARRTGSPPE